MKNELKELKALVRELKSDVQKGKNDNYKEIKEIKNDLGDNKKSIDHMNKGVQSIAINTNELKNLLKDLMREVIDDMPPHRLVSILHL